MIGNSQRIWADPESRSFGDTPASTRETPNTVGDALANGLIFLLTFGLSYFYGPSRDEISERTAGRQHGWMYEIVPFIPHDATGLFEAFNRPLDMSNCAAATVSQSSFWIRWSQRTVAPSGGWAVLPPSTSILVEHDHFWLYTYSSNVQARRLEHGLAGPTPVGILVERLFEIERAELERLVAEKFRGRARVIWPPVRVNERVIS